MQALLARAAVLSLALLSFAADTTTPAQYSTADFRRELRATLTADESLQPDDFSLWPKIADITRRLARSAGAKAANEALDETFGDARSKKLHSHVWAALPGSTIEGLSGHVYRAAYDIYRTGTKHPKIRDDLLAIVSANPSDPFVEFAYYALGDFETAIHERPNSPIKDVLHHAIGFEIVGTIVSDAYVMANSRAPSNIMRPWRADTDRMLRFLNRHPELYDYKPLAQVIPRFGERATAAQAHFELVLQHTHSPLADDAAYLLGWLAYHQGRYDQALRYFSEGMTVGNGDYKAWGTVKQTARIFEKMPVHQQYTTLESNRVLAEQAALWYVAARSAYRNFDYGLASEIGRNGLKTVKVVAENLPVTTDSEQIDQAIEHSNQQLRKDWKTAMHASETAYLIAASREYQKYLEYLPSLHQQSPEEAMLKAKAIVVKYSMLLDQPDRIRGRAHSVAHKDLRQAVHLIDTTLVALPKDEKFRPLREWLHYRKVRILAAFAPARVGEAVAAMENDTPSSQLLDDALAEQIYAEGFMLGDLAAAQKLFQKITLKYPNGNALDNAHSWMAISYRCAGLSDQAQAMNTEIIRRFPATRHAVYAKKRMTEPRSKECYFVREVW